MSAIEIVAGPTQEPITVDRARSERAIPHMLDDDLLIDKIAQARQHVEGILGKALITQTWALHLDEFPNEIRLSGGKVQSVSSIQYWDTDGVQQTLDPSLFQADLFSRVPRIRPAPGECFPATQKRLNAVRVEYVVGYGSPDDVPQDIKGALLLLIGDAYENREGQVVGSIIAQNRAVDRLLWPHRNLEV